MSKPCTSSWAVSRTSASFCRGPSRRSTRTCSSSTSPSIKGKSIGTCALYVTWDNLAEVKALAVEEKYQGQGIGKRLLEAVTQVAKDLHIRRLFTLTIRTGFFERFGFKHVSKDHLPHKVWTECVKCIYFPERCVEYAMVKDLPGQGPTPPPIAFRDKIAPSKHLPAGTIVPSEPVVPGMTIARLSKHSRKK